MIDKREGGICYNRHMPEIKKIEDQFNIDQYETFSAHYIESNKNGGIGGTNPEQRVQFFQKFVPIGRNVLEIGSGAGDEAKMLQNIGYAITASDVVPEFLKLLQQKGLPTIKFDAKSQELPDGLDAIYANAVFVHFSNAELINFLQNAKLKLENEKAIFLSVIKGEGMARDARGRGFPRDFQYYNPQELRELITNEGYSILDFQEPDEKWIQAIISGR
jgi:SAM-dependent methyltransferase